MASAMRWLLVVALTSWGAHASQLQEIADELVVHAANVAATKSGSPSSGKIVAIRNFTHEHCEAETNLIKLSNIVVVSLPNGHIGIRGDADVEGDIQDVNGSIKMELEKGSIKKTIPCMNQIGTCEYPDLCSSLEKLNKSEITCPITKGNYKLPEELKIDLRKFSRILNNHTFHITAKLFSDGHCCLCSHIIITFD